MQSNDQHKQPTAWVFRSLRAGNSRSVFASLTLLVCASAILSCTPAQADAPPGWIDSNNPSAYTTPRGDFSAAFSGITVDDFLDIREDLIAGDRRLEGDSGDLSGYRFELNYGITDWLSVYYREQRHALRVDLGGVASVNVLDIDTELNTTAREAGFKWTLYFADLLTPGDYNTAFSVELSAFENKSDSFDVVIDEISVDNSLVSFQDPQTFSVNDLKDDGWQGRVVVTRPLSQSSAYSAWVGYREANSTSATGSDIATDFVARLFDHQFKLDESFLRLGASLHFQFSPRWPVLLSYEYIKREASEFFREPLEPDQAFPGFLPGGPALEDSNHTLFGRVSHWLTPRLNVSLTGNFYSNQFLGVLPHYHNPLSRAPADNAYGIGLELGYSLRRP